MAKILVVDDSEFMRSIIKKIVEVAGYEVISEASNGLEAIEQYKLHRPDIVTMDITMPEMDGLTALREIIAWDRNAKVVMATAMNQEQIIKESVLSGAKDYLIKPFHVDEVMRVLKRLIASS